MKNNWNTTTPPVSDTGKSKILLCHCEWENAIYLALAFYNANTKEWITQETHQVVNVIEWKDME